jgi:hypothetical protein
VIAAYTHQPFDIPTPVPIIGDPLTRRVAELGTVAYELVLHLLIRFFTHTNETNEQLGMLIGTAIELMADVVRPIGTMMTRLPVPEHLGKTAGLTFQMHYAMGNFVPWRESAWALLHERMAFLLERCEHARAHDGTPDAVHEAGEKVGALTAKLAAHVPGEMRGTGAPG